jgi:hypothetical protein
VWLASEREELAVWADQLQQRGDPWGELIATSQALASACEPHTDSLHARLAELQRELVEPRVGALLRDHASLIHPIWAHGMLMGLILQPTERTPTATMERAVERAAELLRLPVARSLWFLQIDPWPGGDAPTITRSATAELLAPEIVARPRVIVFGRPYLSYPGSDSDVVQRLGTVDRGVVELVIYGVRQLLPWAPGDKGSRFQAMQRLRARVRAHGLSARDRTLLARALWDRSQRVRIAGLDCLAELGRDAAVFVPELVSVQPKDQRWLARRDSLLRELIVLPGLVEYVRDNFTPEQAHVLAWLEGITGRDDRALDRVVAMLQQSAGLLPHASELVQLVRRHRPDFELPPRSPPRSRSLFERALAWLRK